MNNAFIVLGYQKEDGIAESKTKTLWQIEMPYLVGPRRWVVNVKFLFSVKYTYLMCPSWCNKTTTDEANSQQDGASKSPVGFQHTYQGRKKSRDKGCGGTNQAESKGCALWCSHSFQLPMVHIKVQNDTCISATHIYTCQFKSDVDLPPPPSTHPCCRY